ncbi:hypothetical protein OG883_28760 [Streptomyces sp. NBC_01142]|uniref:hypothetical protein n=1 Tax=Streptomyces sp. NBC_01142 TaxID=2975865 RepID=UPI002252F957|nr:hypothetical protein [Streptomyces sp. NBC_01142]MCX4823795.1 hypothetical protein [Streptomyces sp. NBC_01142]
MMRMRFSVLPGQGEPNGFDLGDMLCFGDLGEATSQGHTPDQGMMIYLSVTLLLDNLRQFLKGSNKVLSYTGVDTSFNITVRRIKNGMFSVSAGNTLLDRVGLDELTQAVLAAAEEFATCVFDLPEDDAARHDYLAAINDFRTLTNNSTAK